MTAPKKATKPKAPTKKAPARARRTTSPGKRGPAPLVTIGFAWTPATRHTAGTATWAPKSPAAEVLAALSVGATWEHAASYAKLHEATPRQWNTRGTDALGDHESLDALHRTRPTTEAMAYAAFTIAARQARVDPVVGALDEIDRARRKGDWKAGAHQLKVLPAAREYRERTRHEVTGEDGGPVEVDVTEAAERAILDLADQFAGDDTDPDD